MLHSRALCCCAVAVLTLSLLAPACKHRRRKRKTKQAAPAKVDAAAAATKATKAAAPAPQPIRPDAAPPKGPAWCAQVAEGNVTRGDAETPSGLPAPGQVLQERQLRRLGRLGGKGCCRQAARWRAELKEARLEFVILQEVRHGNDGIYALVLRRLPAKAGHCVLGAYAKVHGGAGTSFERISVGEVGQGGRLARLIFRFRGQQPSFENDDGTVTPGEVTRYNVVLISDGAKLWSATWTDAAQKDLRTAVLTGRRLAGQKQVDEALELYERAYAIQPYSPQIAAEIGDLALSAGKLKLAQKYYRRALRFAFGSVLRAQILFSLGQISDKRGELAEAEAHYAQSLKLRASGEVRARLRALKRRRRKEQ